MATPKFNAKSPTIKRILREAQELSSSPSPDYHAAPASDSDLFDWHFTLRGPPSSSFAEGYYHGRIVLPPTYPLKPPMFRFLTPSGRFEVNREICLSISAHHEETWSPSWGIRTALTALRTFMETNVKGQLGGMETSKKERERLAAESGKWKCSICQRTNEEILDESSEAARLKAEADGDAGGSEKKEDEVPAELKISYKDETTKNESVEEKKKDEDDAQLAEGFVRTGNVNDPSTSDPSSSLTSTPYPRARPAQRAAQATNSMTQSTPAPPRITQAPTTTFPRRQVQVRSNDGVPIWLDRTIAAVVICLIAMVLKVLFGF